MRIDKWLWTVRLFKSRSLATSACKEKRVKIAGQNIKPAREIKIGEEVEVAIGFKWKTFKVLDLPKNRLPAKLTPDYIKLLSEREY